MYQTKENSQGIFGEEKLKNLSNGMIFREWNEVLRMHNGVSHWHPKALCSRIIIIFHATNIIIHSRIQSSVRFEKRHRSTVVVVALPTVAFENPAQRI